MGPPPQGPLPMTVEKDVEFRYWTFRVLGILHILVAVVICPVSIAAIAINDTTRQGELFELAAISSSFALYPLAGASMVILTILVRVVNR